MAAQEDAKKLRLVVKSDSGQDVTFDVRPGVLFSKVFAAYCKRTGTDEKEVRFLFDGQRLRKDQSPESYDMEDEDVIDAMVEQTGGRVFSVL